ncbi:CinA family protein [Candidatus Thioglobus sp.]|jgi:nicotinamide-nucleotide amidase|uniref:CinA family protein n=1 Tax=Candidatus Thioglobus sp. TaxID=2026721 RepID=UPI001DE50230|nr:CinA family protein [Candidatus Thioglobus sp.]MBT3276668.1 CinA family protein [Candidatus Thioglobus sp.]MBT3447438.1 CinA family protein [Candidatus Thioglobus sp.]MBT3745099.1 CinA family protein [Candidatus Thioglobus sp.]MBT4000487.1 CinA family protein [Candidatus Thioglobus sp.]MBT4181989.1 CinA family protein [Candidatus Thioglobus sp.]
MLKLKQLTDLLTAQRLTVAVAESCTGGALCSLLTSQSGSSVYFDRGFITYSNQAKIDMLGVLKNTLEEFGAVSEQTAGQMASGVINQAKTGVSVSITGIAGPQGGSQEKPVGMVCFGFCILGACFTSTQNFAGNRQDVVNASIDFVLTTLIDELSS